MVFGPITEYYSVRRIQAIIGNSGLSDCCFTAVDSISIVKVTTNALIVKLTVIATIELTELLVRGQRQRLVAGPASVQLTAFGFIADFELLCFKAFMSALKSFKPKAY